MANRTVNDEPIPLLYGKGRVDRVVRPAGATVVYYMRLHVVSVRVHGRVGVVCVHHVRMYLCVLYACVHVFVYPHVVYVYVHVCVCVRVCV